MVNHHNTGLENWQACKRLVGSNPTPSAIPPDIGIRIHDLWGAARRPRPLLFVEISKNSNIYNKIIMLVHNFS